ncbi:MAG: hypothetical protein ABIQ31_09560 [Ferruginibacter sp.]
MDLAKEDFPATIQAFDLQQDKEVFLAEQVVNSQSEIEIFTTCYTGKLIKAKKVPIIVADSKYTPVYKKQRSLTGLIMIVVILVLVILVIYGFSTGWIQQKLNLKV